LGLFKCISDYLPYFEKKIYFSISLQNKLELMLRIDQNDLFGSFEITSIRLRTPLRNPLRAMRVARCEQPD
jgi:hypothetical protein